MNDIVKAIFEDAQTDIEDMDLLSWFMDMNSSDHMSINIRDKGAFRSNFNVAQAEDLLYCRDTSFWNNRNQGAVVTDWGVRVIPDNEKPEEMISFSWEDVYDVTYKDDVFYFWGSPDHNEENCAAIHNTYFVKDNSLTMVDFNSIAKLFTRMAQAVQPQEHPVVAEIDKLWKMFDDDPVRAEKYGRELLGKYPEQGCIIYYNMGVLSYFKLKDKDKAIMYLEKYLEYKAEDKFMNTWAHTVLASAKIFENERGTASSKDVMYHCFMASLGDPDVKNDNGTSLVEMAKNDLMDQYKEYFGDDYNETDYKEHKLIYPIQNIFSLSSISQTQMMPVPISSIENNPLLSFPTGHPVVNQLYVCHPYNQSKYLLYENYEIEILQDKLREFSEIAQALGATEIDVKVISSNEHQSSTKGSQNISGKVDHWVADSSAKMELSSAHNEQINFEHMFNRHQTFVPRKDISVPKETLWLQHEPGWQRLVKQRLEGGLLSHKEIIETRTSKVVSGSASTTLKGEMNSIFVDLGLEWNETSEHLYSEHNNLVLSVNVTFAPDASPKSEATSILLTAKEQEYKEEFDACIEDGQISPTERRLLDRLAKSLGLTPEQVDKIENMNSMVLSPEEKEYLEEYRNCLAEDPNITSSTRRLLNKLATSLGLSNEQIQKVENLREV